MTALDLPPSPTAFSPPMHIVERTGRRGSEMPDDVTSQHARFVLSRVQGSSTAQEGQIAFDPFHLGSSTVLQVQVNVDPLQQYADELIRKQQESRRIKTAIQQRLRELKCDAELTGDSISQASVQDFLSFITSAAPMKLPSIFLLDSGNVRALWLNDRKEQVGLQFMGDQEVQFVMFVQRTSMTARSHGIEALSSILEKIRSNKCEHLIY